MIFPDWGTTPKTATSALPLYRDWAMDWETGEFARRDGKYYLISGAEALRNWVRCALHSENVRYLYSAHSGNYGNALVELLGESMAGGILENRLRKEIRETLMVSPYITGVDGFVFTRKGAAMTVQFTVHTLYETFDEEVRLS